MTLQERRAIVAQIKTLTEQGRHIEGPSPVRGNHPHQVIFQPMNILKATIAVAAVTVCCMGNDYPAKADMSPNEVTAFRAGKDFGYAMGLVAQSCVNYAAGDISRKQLAFFFDVASTLDNTNQAMRDAIVNNMRRMSEKRLNKAGIQKMPASVDISHGQWQ